jgi:hypothetical protein
LDSRFWHRSNYKIQVGYVVCRLKQVEEIYKCP